MKITKTGSAIAALVDNGNLISFENSTNDYSYQIPAHSTVPFPIMSWIELRKTGTGDITISRAGSVTFAGALGNVDFKIDGEEGYSVFIRQTALNVWEYSGSLKSL